ncbi:MAG: AAA family ATPase [Bacteroidota bacterium]
MTGKHYFIARPQRFGKSLFIDTLAEILRGNKALFRDCVIAQKDYDWQTYPIVLFNFEQMACSNPLEFEESLRKRSQAIAQEYALSTTSYLQQASPPNI